MFLRTFKHHEVKHWLFHRLTAVILFVTFYFEFCTKTGIFSFYNFILILSLIFVAFHFRAGTQVLVDDYQHDSILNIMCINLLRFSAFCSIKSLIYFQFFIV